MTRGISPADIGDYSIVRFDDVVQIFKDGSSDKTQTESVETFSFDDGRTPALSSFNFQRTHTVTSHLTMT